MFSSVCARVCACGVCLNVKHGSGSMNEFSTVFFCCLLSTSLQFRTIGKSQNIMICSDEAYDECTHTSM